MKVQTQRSALRLWRSTFLVNFIVAFRTHNADKNPQRQVHYFTIIIHTANAFKCAEMLRKIISTLRLTTSSWPVTAKPTCTRSKKWNMCEKRETALRKQTQITTQSGLLNTNLEKPFETLLCTQIKWRLIGSDLNTSLPLIQMFAHWHIKDTYSDIQICLRWWFVSLSFIRFGFVWMFICAYQDLHLLIPLSRITCD